MFKIKALLLVLIFFPVLAGASDLFQYAKILDVQGKDLLIQYGGVDEHPVYRCGIDTLACSYVATSAPAVVVPTEFKNSNYFYNSDKSLAFVSRSNGGSTENIIYRTSAGSVVLDKKLNLADRLLRVFWINGNDKIIAVTKSDPAEIITYDLTANKEISRLEADITNASRLSVSPDGGFFAYYRSSMFSKTKDRTFYLVNLATGERFEKKSKVDYWDLLTEESKLIDFSPDSKKMAYLDDRSGYLSLYVVDLESKAKTMLAGQPVTTKKYNINDFLFLGNNDVFFVANRRSPQVWSLYHYNLTSQNIEEIVADVSYAQPIRFVGNLLLALERKNNSVLPVLYDPETKLQKFFPAMTLAPVQTTAKETPVTLGSMSGVLVKPASYSAAKTYPVLIWLHGGPYRQAAIGFHSYSSYAIYDWILGKVAESGVVVLKLDYRGSYGYGRAFSEKIKYNAGKGDVADVTSALASLEKKMKVSKVYLVGNSYGGYLSLRTIVEKPKLFAGAFSINGVTNWPMLLKHFGNSIFNIYFDGLPNGKNTKLFKQAAIEPKINNLGQQKIFIAQSTDDNTVPADQGPYMTELLVEAKKNVEYIQLPDEDHVPKQKTNIVNLCHSVFDFLGLSGGGSCDV